MKAAVGQAVDDFAARGFRALGVARADAEGSGKSASACCRCSIRRGSRLQATIATARQMGVGVKMVTGDALAIARETASKLGHGQQHRRCRGLRRRRRTRERAAAQAIEHADGFAQVFPSTSTTSSTCCSGAATSSA